MKVISPHQLSFHQMGFRNLFLIMKMKEFCILSSSVDVGEEFSSPRVGKVSKLTSWNEVCVLESSCLGVGRTIHQS